MSLSHRLVSITAAALVGGLGLAGQAKAADSAPPYRVSGPYVYENLDAYLIHSPDSAAGRKLVPLHEALERRLVTVIETSTVSELTIENPSDQEVYVQAGDIVKGGRQDRVLGTDLLLPPHSGRVPIASFCVEQGRWRQRGAEASDRFTSAGSNLAHKDLKIANAQGSQSAVWSNVAKVQEHLASNLGGDVRSRESASSLQLTLENDRVRKGVEGFVQALTSLVEAHSDVTGYAFAINGALNSADVYVTHALFLKLWPKLLRASAIEAVAERKAPAPHTPPTIETVSAFLTDAAKGPARDKPVSATLQSLTRETDSTLLLESREPGKPAAWIHRSFIRK